MASRQTEGSEATIASLASHRIAEVGEAYAFVTVLAALVWSTFITQKNTAVRQTDAVIGAAAYKPALAASDVRRPASRAYGHHKKSTHTGTSHALA